MLFEYFEELRKKPPEVRKRFALFFSGVCTSVVVVVWVISLLLGAFGARGSKSDINKSEVVDIQETTSTMFKEANTFIEDTGVVGDFTNEDWTQELQTLETDTTEDPLNPQVVVGTSTPVGTSTVNTYATPTQTIFKQQE